MFINVYELISIVFSGLNTNFSVTCESGKINVTLEQPSNIDIDRYFSMITLKESPHMPINMSLHERVKAFLF